MYSRGDEMAKLLSENLYRPRSGILILGPTLDASCLFSSYCSTFLIEFIFYNIYVGIAIKINIELGVVSKNMILDT